MNEIEKYNNEEHQLDYIQRQLKRITKDCNDENTKSKLKELNEIINDF